MTGAAFKVLKYVLFIRNKVSHFLQIFERIMKVFMPFEGTLYECKSLGGFSESFKIMKCRHLILLTSLAFINCSEFLFNSRTIMSNLLHECLQVIKNTPKPSLFFQTKHTHQHIRFSTPLSVNKLTLFSHAFCKSC